MRAASLDASIRALESTSNIWNGDARHKVRMTRDYSFGKGHFTNSDQLVVFRSVGQQEQIKARATVGPAAGLDRRQSMTAPGVITPACNGLSAPNQAVSFSFVSSLSIHSALSL